MQDDQNQNQNPAQNLQQADDNQFVSQNPQQYQPPVSIKQKEYEPISNQPAEANIAPSEHEPTLHPEVAASGVSTVSDKVYLTSAHRQVGITEAKESTPVSLNPSGRVNLPMNQNQAEIAVKGKADDSLTWLAKIVLVYFKKLGGKGV